MQAPEAFWVVFVMNEPPPGEVRGTQQKAKCGPMESRVEEPDSNNYYRMQRSLGPSPPTQHLALTFPGLGEGPHTLGRLCFPAAILYAHLMQGCGAFPLGGDPENLDPVRRVDVALSSRVYGKGGRVKSHVPRCDMKV